jgi:hypothetical protein
VLLRPRCDVVLRFLARKGDICSAGAREPPDLGPHHSLKPGGRHKSPVHHFANSVWCISAFYAAVSNVHSVAHPGLKPFKHPCRWLTPTGRHMPPSGLRGAFSAVTAQGLVTAYLFSLRSTHPQGRMNSSSNILRMPRASILRKLHLSLTGSAYLVDKRCALKNSSRRRRP